MRQPADDAGSNTAATADVSDRGGVRAARAPQSLARDLSRFREQRELDVALAASKAVRGSGSSNGAGSAAAAPSQVCSPSPSNRTPWNLCFSECFCCICGIKDETIDGDGWHGCEHCNAAWVCPNCFNKPAQRARLDAHQSRCDGESLAAHCIECDETAKELLHSLCSTCNVVALCERCRGAGSTAGVDFFNVHMSECAIVSAARKQYGKKRKHGESGSAGAKKKSTKKARAKRRADAAEEVQRWNVLVAQELSRIEKSCLVRDSWWVYDSMD